MQRHLHVSLRRKIALLSLFAAGIAVGGCAVAPQASSSGDTLQEGSSKRASDYPTALLRETYLGMGMPPPEELAQSFLGEALLEIAERYGSDPPGPESQELCPKIFYPLVRGALRQSKVDAKAALEPLYPSPRCAADLGQLQLARAVYEQHFLDFYTAFAEVFQQSKGVDCFNNAFYAFNIQFDDVAS